MNKKIDKNEAYKARKQDNINAIKQDKKKVNDEIKRQKAKENKEKLAYNQNALELEKQFYKEWIPEVFK